MVMQVAILAGGFGTRLAEETVEQPKPLVEVGGRPILWHIMMHYSHFGFSDFLIALGYQGRMIKRYFIDYYALESNLTVDLRKGTVTVREGPHQNWTIDLIDTGINTQTGGRIKRLAPYLEKDTFMLSWSDAVSDLSFRELLAFHRGHGRLATLAVVRAPARFGHVDLEDDQVVTFAEKPEDGGPWINAGHFVLEPEVLDYIAGDETRWEGEPLEQLTRDGQLMAFRHTSFWQCMDTLDEKQLLNRLWQSGVPPWKIWED
jgi:glucose-1-phosphate cytidylyltransferase